MMEMLINYTIILKISINMGLGEKTELDYRKNIWCNYIKGVKLM